MPASGYSGVSPDARECPRCGKRVGGLYMGFGFNPGRHKNKAGVWCREPKHEPGTRPETLKEAMIRRRVAARTERA